VFCVKIFSTNSPTFWNVVFERTPKRSDPSSRRMSSTIKRPCVTSISSHGRVFTIHLDRSDHVVEFELRSRLQHSIVVDEILGPREVISSRVLDSSGFFSRELLISPLIVDLILRKVRRKNDVDDVTSLSDLFNRDDGVLTIPVMLFADGGTIVQIVATIRPELSLHDVVSIYCRKRTEYACVVVSIKDSLAEGVARQEDVFTHDVVNISELEFVLEDLQVLGSA